MSIVFNKFLPSEINILIDFIMSDKWPFHGYPEITSEKIRKTFEDGFYTGNGIETFWLISDGKRAGMIRLYDLDDITPLFDIRILSSYRGKGMGKEAVKWLTEYMFNTYSHVMRIEGYTRQDNLPMRRVFEKCGYVKEAHHRKSWPGPDNVYFDTIGYCILREDWKDDKVTPVKWDDRLLTQTGG